MRNVWISIVWTLVWAGAGTGQDIVINEIMYNSPGADVEFIELFNNSQSAVDLSGWTLLDDNDSHTPCQLSGTVNAGGYFIIAGNLSLFNQKYTGVQNINPNDYDTGSNAWSFGNGGDVVRLYNNSGTLIDSVDYDEGGTWPGSPDGDGPSLELLHPNLNNALPTSWDPSNSDNGTPGAQNSVYTTNVMPTCKDGARDIDLPASADAVLVTVTAFDNEGLATVQLYVNTGSGYAPMAMNDAGTGGDAAAGDSIYSVIIPAQTNGTLVKYYTKATDDIGQQDNWPNNAPTEYHAYTVGYTPPNLRISEILAINNTTNKDAYNDYDDWIEIHNAGTSSVNLNGMYLGNSFGNSKQFALPAVNLIPGGYLIVWADDDDQGALHANFRLSSSGETVGIFETIDHGNVLIHGWKFGLMSADVSMGYASEDATAPDYLTPPTPGLPNVTSSLFSPVCINEFQCTSDFGGPDDWIEIYNRGTQPYDLSGCFLSDSRNNPTKWQFPDNYIIQPGQFKAVHEDVLGFGLSSEGDDVILLTRPDTTTGLDFYDFGLQTADHSEGRSPDGSGKWTFFNTPTKEAANATSTISNNKSDHPAQFALNQNYPNPFNPETVISYQLPVASKIELNIYNSVGQKVKQIYSGKQQPGSHKVIWDGRCMNGMPVSSGIYIYRLSGDGFTEQKKMILMR